jgi:hypothetical protein
MPGGMKLVKAQYLRIIGANLSIETSGGKKFYFGNAYITSAYGPYVPKLNIVYASNVMEESLNWLWPNRVAFEKLNLFAG